MSIGRRFFPSTNTMVTTELQIWLLSLRFTSHSFVLRWKYLWTLSLRSLSLCPSFSKIPPSGNGTSIAQLGPSSTRDGGGLWHSAIVAALGGKSGLRIPHVRSPLGVSCGDGSSVLALQTGSLSEMSSPETGWYSVSELRDKWGSGLGLLLLSGSVSESPQLSPSPSASAPADAEPPR